MWAWLLPLLEGAAKILGALFVKPAPTVADKAAEAATAETKLASKEADNAVTNQAAAARADADLGVVRAVAASGPAVQPAVNDQLAKQFSGEFRD